MLRRIKHLYKRLGRRLRKKAKKHQSIQDKLKEAGVPERLIRTDKEVEELDLTTPIDDEITIKLSEPKLYLIEVHDKEEMTTYEKVEHYRISNYIQIISMDFSDGETVVLPYTKLHIMEMAKPKVAKSVK